MRPSLAALAVTATLVTATAAHAQPGADAPPPNQDPYAAPPSPPPPAQPYQPQGYPQQGAPQPQGYPSQPGYPPQGYPQQPRYPQQPGYPGYGPPVQLTLEDQELLAQGEITDGQMLGGAAVAFFVGFGTGQAVQGRWSEKGWMFALGEVATLTLMVYGVAQVLDDCFRSDISCNQSNDARGETALIVGAVGFGVLRVWEIVDALSAPSSHNARVRELRIRTGQQPTYYGMKPFVSPKGDGLAAGLSWRF